MHASNKANDDDNVTMRSTNVKVESSTKMLLDSDTTQFQIEFHFDSLYFVQILPKVKVICIPFLNHVITGFGGRI